VYNTWAAALKDLKTQIHEETENVPEEILQQAIKGFATCS
jgi:hypothetical protein